MKKLLSLLLVIFACLSLAACGYYTEAVTPPPSGPSEEEPTDPSDPTVTNPDLKDMFTVTCKLDKGNYRFSGTVQWTGLDGSVYRAEMDENHVAVCAESKEMDGEYYISIEFEQSSMVYRPDIYVADNENKHVEVTVYSATTIATTDIYEGNILKRVPSKVEADKLYIADVPRNKSVFFIMDPQLELETWCSTRENNILPKLTGYTANLASGFINSVGVECTGGGSSGSYTKNVKASYELVPRLERANCNVYGISATRLSGMSPTIPVPFYVKRSGYTADGTQEPPIYEKVHVQETDLLKVYQPTSQFVYNYKMTGGMLRGSRYKLFKKGTTDSAGHKGDGYYHVYDSASNTYGALLFAVITKDTEVIETEGANCGFLYGRISLRYDGKDYEEFFGIIDSNTNKRDAKLLPADVRNNAYSLYTNEQGAHPVTEELKEFLQAYATGQSLFNDGEGWAETVLTPGLKASEDDMWLFACGTYTNFLGDI